MVKLTFRLSKERGKKYEGEKQDTLSRYPFQQTDCIIMINSSTSYYICIYIYVYIYTYIRLPKLIVHPHPSLGKKKKKKLVNCSQSKPSSIQLANQPTISLGSRQQTQCYVLLDVVWGGILFTSFLQDYLSVVDIDKNLLISFGFVQEVFILM